MAKYDGIIIGAGPNGLTVGAYLAKAGFKILLLDRRYEMGGGLATELVTVPGFLHDTHAIFHLMVEYAPPLKDLGLEENYDLQWIYPSVQVAMVFLDGSSIILYQDIEKSCESIRKISPKDADAYKKFAEQASLVMDTFLAPATYHEAIPLLEQVAKMEKMEITRWIDELTGVSPKDIVDGIFENDKVRALFLSLATMWGLEYDLEGVGYLVPLMIDRATHNRLCRGGSHHLAHLMSKVIYEHGGMILASTEIKRIIIENGEAKGVELANGTVIEANKFVASSLDQHQTWFKLVGEKYLEPDFIQRLKDWQWEEWALFNVHLALHETPNFKAAAQHPDVNKALIVLVGYESEQDVVNHFEAIRRGELGEHGFKCCFPTIYDPTRAWPGKHIGLLSQEAPYNLKGDGAQGWYRVRREQAERNKAVLRKYAPNMTDDNVMVDYITTPLDIENKFPDMVKGGFKQGAYAPLQMGYQRPNEYCSRHFTPIKNLYVCGASTYSGGMVTFGPGYNAANRIAEDLNIEKWWQEPEHVRRAKEAGLL